MKPHIRHCTHRYSCGCATTLKEARYICVGCGALYTLDLISFNIFHCYDCGGVVYKSHDGKKRKVINNPEDILKEPIETMYKEFKGYGDNRTGKIVEVL